MLTQETLDNETLLTGPMGILPAEELRDYFNSKRYADDEFARDFAKHEFVDWLNSEQYREL